MLVHYKYTAGGRKESAKGEEAAGYDMTSDAKR